jgi:hypothetical protein
VTVAVYLFATVVHVKMNIVDALATMLGAWKMGMLVHVLNGAIVFPLAYAVFFYRLLRGLSYVKGLTFGLTLWRASQLVVLPMIGAGVFSSHMGCGQGRRDVAVRSPDLRRVAGLAGWRCYQEDVRG